MPLELTIETFAETNPAMNADLFLDPAREALARYHVSPARMRVLQNEVEQDAAVSFDAPDPRSGDSMERPRIVEHAAIVFSGVLLAHLHGKQITRVVNRGLRVDYYVGDAPGDFSSILEVGGTDEGRIVYLRAKKREQLLASPLRAAPHWKPGYVAVTRFAPDAESALDPVAAGN